MTVADNGEVEIATSGTCYDGTRTQIFRIKTPVEL